MNNLQKSLVTIAELSQLSGLSVSTIRRLVRDERILFVQPAGKGGKLLFAPDAISNLPKRNVTVPSGSVGLAGRRPKWTMGLT